MFKIFFKKKIFLCVWFYIFFVVLLFILSGCEVKYNSIDIISQIGSNEMVEKPTNLFATYGNFKNGIYISWDYYTTQDTTFHIFRSNSPDGVYELISDKVRYKYFVDYKTIPGIDYFYKVKAVTLTKEGELSDFIKGKRSGRMENYEYSNEISNPLHIKESERNKIFERAIFNSLTFDGDDIDYIKIDLKKNEFVKIELMKTMDQSASFNTLNVSFKDLNGNLLAKFDKQNLNRVFTVTSVSEYTILMEISSDNKESGDYDISVSNFNPEGLISGLTVSSNYSSYVKLNWETKSFLKRYYIQRRVKGSNNEFQNIKVTNSFLSTIEYDYVEQGFCYDRSAEPDIEYEYKIYGYVTDGFGAYSNVVSGKRLTISENNDDDNSFEKAQIVENRDFFVQKDLKLGTMVDVDFYNIKFLEKNKKYKINIKSSETNKVTPFLEIYDSNKNLLFHSTNGEDSGVILNNFVIPVSSDGIFIKVYGIMQTGIYNVEINEN